MSFITRLNPGSLNIWYFFNNFGKQKIIPETKHIQLPRINPAFDMKWIDNPVQLAVVSTNLGKISLSFALLLPEFKN
jgi:hypothetical protein